MKRQLQIELLESRQLLTSFSASLLQDISPGLESTEFGSFYPANERLYFTANNRELWATDGSSEGTTFLADVELGVGRGVLELQSGLALFRVPRSEVGRQVIDTWRTDGTAGGTYALFSERSIWKDPVDVSDDWSLVPILQGDDLELWRVGATAGDVALLTTVLGGRWQVATEFLVHDGVVYASSQSNYPQFQDQLIRTDGTLAGTELIADTLSGFAVVNDVGVHYVAQDEHGMHQLFRIPSASSRPDPGSSGPVQPVPLVQLPGAVRALRLYQDGFAYFLEVSDSEVDSNQRPQTWLLGVSDGTPAGTHALGNEPIANPEWYGDFDDVLVYGTLSNTAKVFRSDGTAEGTNVLALGYAIGTLNGRLYLADDWFTSFNRDISSFTDGTNVFDPWTGESIGPPDFKTRASAASHSNLPPPTIVSPPPAPSWYFRESYIEYYEASSSNPGRPSSSKYYAPDEDGVLRNVETSGSFDRRLIDVGNAFYLESPGRVSRRATTIVQTSKVRRDGFDEVLQVFPQSSQAELLFAFGSPGQPTLWRLREGDIVDAVGPIRIDEFLDGNVDGEPNGESATIDILIDTTSALTAPFSANGGVSKAPLIHWHDKTLVIGGSPDTGNELWLLGEHESTGVDTKLRSTDISDRAPSFGVSVVDPLPDTQYSWDLNDDGRFGDAFGASVVLDWQQFESLDPPIPKNIFRPYHVRTETADGQSSVTTSLLRIKNAGPTIQDVQSIPSEMTIGQTMEFRIAAHDADKLVYIVDYGDGTIEQQSTPEFSHAYAEMGVYSVTVSARDEHGLQADWSREVTVAEVDERARWQFVPGSVFGGNDATSDIEVFGMEFGFPTNVLVTATDHNAAEFAIYAGRIQSKNPLPESPPSNAMTVARIGSDYAFDRLFATADGLYDISGRTSLISTGTDSRDIALGDLNGDNRLDAYVANFSDSDGNPAADAVLVNTNTDRQFSGDAGAADLKFSSFVGTSRSLSVQLGDLNGDGSLDAVTASLQENHIYFNDGNAKFTESSQRLSPGGRFVAIGDVDGDEDLDLVVARNGANLIFKNDGRGHFSQTSQEIGNANSAHAVLGDMDGDGDLDVMFANGIGSASTLWLNNGAGIFVDSGARLATNLNTTRIALADLNPPGSFSEVPSRLDAVFANSGAPNQIYLGAPDLTGPSVVEVQSEIVDLQLQSITIEFSRPVTSDRLSFGPEGQQTVSADPLDLDWNLAQNQVTWDVSDLYVGVGRHYLGISMKDLDGRESSTARSILVERPGDFDGDFRVELNDFEVLMENFGKPVDDVLEGDIDGNGIVDFADFLLFADNFGKN